MILPNTTQIPHIIIRQWMPLLKDIELRILLVVADQTLGWIEDVETGRRKDRDWISHYQLRKRIKRRGAKVCGERSVTQALAKLVDDIKIIEAMTEEGSHLDTPDLRMKNGGKIFYRLNLHPPQPSLFDTPAKSAGVGVPPHKRTPVQKCGLQKKPIIQKKTNADAKKAPRLPLKNRKEDHVRFIDYWVKIVTVTRHIAPVVGPKDGKNLQRVLDIGIDIETLEKLSLYFLADGHFKNLSPTISTMLSSTVLNSLLNLMKNNRDFWRKLDQYMALCLTGEDAPEHHIRHVVTSDHEEPTRNLKIKNTLSQLIIRLRGDKK